MCKRTAQAAERRLAGAVATAKDTLDRAAHAVTGHRTVLITRDGRRYTKKCARTSLLQLLLLKTLHELQCVNEPYYAMSYAAVTNEQGPLRQLWSERRGSSWNVQGSLRP